jgi:hypothetical protein
MLTSILRHVNIAGEDFSELFVFSSFSYLSFSHMLLAIGGARF